MSKFIPLVILNQIAYTPDHPGLESLLHGVAQQLKIESVVAYNDSEQLITALTQNNYLVGIEFADAPEYHSDNPNALPHVLDYALRFPGGLRTGRVNQAIFNWYTRSMFPILQSPGPRNREADDGGLPPGYLQEGFLAIQNSLAHSFVSLQSNRTKSMPNITLQVRLCDPC